MTMKTKSNVVYNNINLIIYLIFICRICHDLTHYYKIIQQLHNVTRNHLASLFLGTLRGNAFFFFFF